MFVSADVDTRPVGPKDVADLARLFESQRTTRRCWCMAFCVTRSQFAAGWLNGGNQRRFGAMAAASSTPLGILASRAAEPVGWCACGPRSRYVAATSPRSKIMRNRARDEDEIVWLLPCLFVRAGRRGQGVTHVLVRAAGRAGLSPRCLRHRRLAAGRIRTALRRCLCRSGAGVRRPRFQLRRTAEPRTRDHATRAPRY
jgi:hypothetical protein